MAAMSLAAPARPHASTPLHRPARIATALSWVIAGMAPPVAATGLLWRGGGEGMFSVTTARGETVELYGRGLYRYDNLFTAGGAHGTDVVVLLLGVPLLIVTTMLLRRGWPRAAPLHAGALLFFLYVYGSASLGAVAHNPAFPAYVAIFSASLFAFIGALVAMDRAALTGPLPRRGPAWFLFASAAVTFLVWAQPEVVALVDATYALDVGIIVPAAVLAGALILRRNPLGYAVAVPLLVLEVLLAPLIAAQTVGQVAAGVSFTPIEVVGPMAGFATLAAVASWFLGSIVRGLGSRPNLGTGGTREHATRSPRHRSDRRRPGGHVPGRLLDLRPVLSLVGLHVGRDRRGGRGDDAR
jgi:hypothetical protein